MGIKSLVSKMLAVLFIYGVMTESFILDDIRNGLSKYKLKFPENPQIEFGKLNDFGGLYGSLEFVKKYYLAK